MEAYSPMGGISFRQPAQSGVVEIFHQSRGAFTVVERDATMQLFPRFRITMERNWFRCVTNLACCL